MRTIDAYSSALLIVDFQARLMPAIHEGEAAVANAKRLLAAATLLEVPILFTEQNPKGLGPTVPGLTDGHRVFEKQFFDACREPGFAQGALPDRPSLVVAGCEAHVCVLQTVLGLLDLRRNVYLVGDALGSRRPESKDTAIRRMERHGAEVVTTEMVLFEWLATAQHPRFREALAVLK
jgi:nicotinamidase-related amidase